MESTTEQRHRTYWKKNLTILGILLLIWFIVSYGCGILFVDELDEYTMGGFKVGFWFAQQGSIYCFIVIIGIYVWYMNRLEKRLGVSED